jgi:hypothetical protein
VVVVMVPPMVHQIPVVVVVVEMTVCQQVMVARG